MYQITEYSYKRAKDLGVTIYPSKRKYKKIDVFKDGKYLASIGDNRYMDYPSILAKEGRETAEKHRRLYHARHRNDDGMPGKLALAILW